MSKRGVGVATPLRIATEDQEHFQKTEAEWSIRKIEIISMYEK